MLYFKPSFWSDLSERVIASFGGGFLAALGVDQVGLLDISWQATLSFAGGTALVSLLKGIAAKKVGDPETAGLHKAPGN